MVLRRIKKSIVKVAIVGIKAARKVKHAVIGTKGSSKRIKAKRVAKKVAKAVARKAVSKGKKIVKRVAQKL